MKYILAITIIFLFSCKKENNHTCWHCTFDTINGYTKPDTTICNDGTMPQNFTDKDGNLIGSSCTK